MIAKLKALNLVEVAPARKKMKTRVRKKVRQRWTKNQDRRLTMKMRTTAKCSYLPRTWKKSQMNKRMTKKMRLKVRKMKTLTIGSKKNSPQ